MNARFSTPSYSVLSTQHTLVVSDLHLSEAEPAHQKNPLWKRFKRPKLFIDRHFQSFLRHIPKLTQDRIELVLAGDIFDFDSVMKLSERLKTSWLERLRGLHSEESKSHFKINTILDDHPVWVESMREFLQGGHSLIFIIGNHDIELHWPSIQTAILNRICSTDEQRARVRFCEWFYISNGDTLIEHGNQYDAYCMTNNPIHPMIRKTGKNYVRLPFGNIAGKFILNGIGLMNPHVDSSFIKQSFREYVIFFYKYVLRTQPFLIWTWFWGAMVTLLISLTDGLLPSMKDPLTAPQRVADIAERANGSPMLVWSLRELHAHPAIYNPIKILRELWLDRALLLGAIVFGSFQIFSMINVFINISILWFIFGVVALFPLFMFYARSIEPEVHATQNHSIKMAPIAARTAGVTRTIQGHLHHEIHTQFEEIEYINTGTWSPAYCDVECTKPYGRKCFAWIRPDAKSIIRIASLFEWTEQGPIQIVKEAAPPHPSQFDSSQK